ncbi:MAG: hypothetical protein RL129_1276 [Actinomycetota bacterium]
MCRFFATKYLFSMESFQPKPEKPVKKKSKLRAKIVLAGLVLSPLAWLGLNGKVEPYCTLNVERVHYSTYLKEYKDIDAIKLNIKSICNVPQAYTEISPSILEGNTNKHVIAHKFETQISKPVDTNRNWAKFEDIFIECKLGAKTNYLGHASGTVRLASGKDFPVSGDSGMYNLVNCRIKPPAGPSPNK